MRPLTDKVMLQAAKRRYAEHVATRPATQAEAHAIRDAHQQAADALLLQAESWEAEARQPAEWGHSNYCVGQALECKRLAAAQMLAAAAWECPGVDMRGAWEATRAELMARVDYYAALCRGEPTVV